MNHFNRIRLFQGICTFATNIINIQCGRAVFPGVHITVNHQLVSHGFLMTFVQYGIQCDRTAVRSEIPADIQTAFGLFLTREPDAAAVVDKVAVNAVIRCLSVIFLIQLTDIELTGVIHAAFQCALSGKCSLSTDIHLTAVHHQRGIIAPRL